jgi:hypothetical protein
MSLMQLIATAGKILSFYSFTGAAITSHGHYIVHTTIYNRCCASTIQLNHTHMVLNPTSVGKSFLFDAQISVRLVSRVKKYSHQTEMPNISPGMIITALANQDANSTML